MLILRLTARIEFGFLKTSHPSPLIRDARHRDGGMKGRGWGRMAQLPMRRISSALGSEQQAHVPATWTNAKRAAAATLCARIWAHTALWRLLAYLFLVFFLIPVAIVLYSEPSPTWRAPTSPPTSRGYGVHRLKELSDFAERSVRPQDILQHHLLCALVTLSIFNVSLALVVSLLTTHIDRSAGFVYSARCGSCRASRRRLCIS